MECEAEGREIIKRAQKWINGKKDRILLQFYHCFSIKIGFNEDEMEHILKSQELYPMDFSFIGCDA